ncbi:glycoside hydrolase family 75 protein [Allokutzneria oryzae]|uniref:Glycoside hydrolase family 75 protein n=1 Tax=Allokutzneria oryzae TaxID=1378989 RepID=A0ABV6A551_9PSEU
MRRTFAKIAAAALALTVSCTVATPASADQAGAAAAPTAAQLKAAVAKCTSQLSSGKYAHDAGGPAKVPVCKTKGAVHWRADLDIDCDGKYRKECKDDPYRQGETAFGGALDPVALPFVVVPGISSRWSYAKSGIGGGTVAAVIYKDKVAYAVVGDVGPTAIIGEGSYALAKALGINPHPNKGGTDGPVDYVLFPGVTAKKINDQASARSLGAAAAAKLVG